MIVTTLFEWYFNNHRNLPWRETNNPYLIWVSEVILQQTKVDQGLDYYLRFIDKFPSVYDLANASEDLVMKMWEGLGYYRRATNMLATAKSIVEDLNGEFPDSYRELIKLKGVGPYIGAAVASFAFKEKVAVVDGNVYRLITRLFDIEFPIDTAIGKKTVQSVLNELIPSNEPDIFNQSVMEFGALQCVKYPICENCVLHVNCLAFKNKTQMKRPVKQSVQKVRSRYFNYFVCRFRDRLLIRKRDKSDIWAQLFEFPYIESNENYLQQGEIDMQIRSLFPNVNYRLIDSFVPSVHKLTHQTIYSIFFIVDLLKQPNKIVPEQGVWVLHENLFDYAFPRIITANLDRILSKV
jgi:A/G-specific adenine glycosylase